VEALEDRLAPSTFHVNSLLDTGAGAGTSGDLRYCVTQANANPGPNTITFDVTGTVGLTGALPAVTGDLDVQGPGASSLTVSGNSLYRVFAVNPGVTATLSGLTVANGRAPNADHRGGGVLNQGDLTLSGCTVSGNNAGGSRTIPPRSAAASTTTRAPR
jgi:hypothetical protein